MDKKLFTKMVLFFLIFYSIYHTMIRYNLGTTNYDFINEGYSSLWLLVLYIIGGYLGRFFINDYSFYNIININLQIGYYCNIFHQPL